MRHPSLSILSLLLMSAGRHAHAEEPNRDKLIAEVKRLAIPLKTERAGNGFEDLEPLGKAIGYAKIVGLGEASHGTAEFFRMKHRLLEYLVEKKGFTVFAIEANWPESEMADRYVKGGEGDPASALQSMYFWTWQTEEVGEMLDWMRAYNARPGVTKKLTFTSFDMQFTEVAEMRVRDYLDKVDRARGETVSKLYEGLQDGRPATPPKPEELAARKDRSVEAVKIFERNREAFEKASSPEEYRTALQCARIIEQCCAMKAGNAYHLRDKSMADNIRWLAEQAYPKEKIVLWAHNGHVSAEKYGPIGEPMGAHLRKVFGDDYFVIGFASDQGSIRAIRMKQGQMTPGGPVSIPLPKAAEGSVEALFRSTAIPRLALPLRGLPAGSLLKKYAAEPHTHRMPGAAYDPDNDAMMYVRAPLGKMYDALIYLAESTAAKPLKPMPSKQPKPMEH